MTLTPWRLQKIVNKVVSYPALAIRRLEIAKCWVLMKIVGAETLIWLPTFWITLYIRFGAVVEIGFKQHMGVTKETAFFIILGTEIDKATAIIGEYVIESLFGKKLLAILG